MKIPSDFLFVDTSGWLAYLDERDPNHTKAVESIGEAGRSILTSDYVLWELGYVKLPHIHDTSLASLVWRLWKGQAGEVLQITEEDELLAWKVFLRHSGLSPSFADCTSLVLLSKHKISRWLSFNRWLPKTPEGIEETLSKLT